MSSDLETAPPLDPPAGVWVGLAAGLAGVGLATTLWLARSHVPGGAAFFLLSLGAVAAAAWIGGAMAAHLRPSAGAVEDAWVRGVGLERRKGGAIFEHLGLTLSGQLDMATLAKAVTDAGVAMTGAAFGAFLYKDGSGSPVHYVTGAPPGAFVDFPLSQETDDPGLAVQGHRLAQRRPRGGPAVRSEPALQADAGGSRAGPELPAGPRPFEHRRPSAAGSSSDIPIRGCSASTDEHLDRQPGRARRHRRRQRAPLSRGAGGRRGGRGGEPREGRVPRDALARAADAADRDRGLGEPAEARALRRRRDGARARHHPPQRDRAEPDHRRAARRVADHHRQAAARPARGRRRRPREGGGRDGDARRQREGHPPAADPGPGGELRHGRSRPAPAGVLEPALQRHQVHAQERPRPGERPVDRLERRGRRGRHGPRHRPRVPAPHLRALHPGRFLQHPHGARPGPRPLHRAPAGGAARRHHPRGERRRRLRRPRSRRGSRGRRSPPPPPRSRDASTRGRTRRSDWSRRRASTACGCWWWRTTTTPGRWSKPC